MSDDEGEVNAFKNDGSFIEQFKKMQEQKQQNQTKTNTSGPSISARTTAGLVKKNTRVPAIRLGGFLKTRGANRVVKPGDSSSSEEPVANSAKCSQTDTKQEERESSAAEPPQSRAVVEGPAAESTSTTPAGPSSLPHPTPLLPTPGGAEQEEASPSTQVSRKRKRKSRWAEPPSSEEMAILDAIHSFGGAVAQQQKLTQSQYQQLMEQKEINRLVAEIQASTHKGRSVKGKYEYDSDEEITEDGTWEHRLRKAEMIETAIKAKELTVQARGKHHIGDFLPPDELAKFVEKVRAVKEERAPDLSEYKDHKLTKENIGFQLLQKAGWKEGSGLGTKEDGIVNPVEKGKLSFDQSGVGMEQPAEVKKADDEFQTYRKRMMLAYRFRPNPLNNPRRPYY